MAPDVNAITAGSPAPGASGGSTPAPRASMSSSRHRTPSARRAAAGTSPTEIIWAPVPMSLAAASPLAVPITYAGPALRRATRIPRIPRPASTTTAMTPARQSP